MISASSLSRRHFLHTAQALLMGTTGLMSSGWAADNAAFANWPNKPVRIVVAFPPAGGSDILARSLGEVLQRELQQAFVVDNRPGAGGNIGADNVAKSPADGYAALLSIDTIFTINPFIYSSMPFRSSDLRPVMLLASQGLAVVVNPKTGLTSFQQLIERGQQQAINLSSGGNGTPGHLAAANMTRHTGAKINHVPYKGSSPASVAIIAGEVDGGIISASPLWEQAAAGKVRPLAVTSSKRNPLAPDVPTVAELGYPALEQEVLYALWLPAATPEPLFQKIQHALEKAMTDTTLRERMRNNDLAYEALTGDAAVQRLQAATEHYRDVIKATGMKLG